MPTTVRDLLDVLPFAVGIRGIEEQVKWSYVNPAMCQLLGYDEPRALLESVTFDVLPDDRDRAAAMERRRALLRGDRLGFHAVRWRRRDGSVLPIEITAALLADFEGKPAIMLVGRDLIERGELRSRLAIAERMVSIGTLAAGVAHEINNPLTYLILGLDRAAHDLRALAEGWSDDGAARLMQSLDVARDGARRVQTIVQSMKSMSQVDDGRVPVDVRGVLESAIDVVRHQIAHRARLVQALDPVPPVLANAGRLGQVFVNLLANAAQAIPVGRANDNEVAVLTGVAPDGQVVVEVRDTGNGFSPHVLPRIFDPFFTTKNVGEGMGLGLAICHGIVTSLGGSIAAFNREPRGAVLRIALPPAEAILPSTPEQRAISAAAGARGRVLVVDDDPKIGLACSMALETAFEVVVVSSVCDALAQLHEGEAFDVILCDLMMPVQTGIDLYAELGDARHTMRDRVVFMTGGAFTENARKFLDEVPNLRLDKPFTGAELVGILRKAIGRTGY